VRISARLGILAACLGLAISPGVFAAGKVTAPGGSYRIQLTSFASPPEPPSGLLVRARVNGGPLLRLLLDSGAQHVVLSRRSAAKSGCAGGTDLSLVSPGAAVPSAAKSVRAETIQVGDFVARDVDVLVTDNKVAEGVDGVLPLALFGGFVIRLDMPSKSLDLDPYPEQAPRQTGDLAAVRNHDLLFVKCQVNGARDGYFLLDTGASYNAISRALARTLNSSDLFGSDISLRGGTVPVAAARPSPPAPRRCEPIVNWWAILLSSAAAPPLPWPAETASVQPVANRGAARPVEPLRVFPSLAALPAWLPAWLARLPETTSF